MTPPTSLRGIIDAIPLAWLVALCLVAVTATGLWLASALARPSPMFARTIAMTEDAGPSNDGAGGPGVPDEVLTVTLYDELFPAPAEPPKPPPPPKLELELKAILGEGDARRVFVLDTREGGYLTLSVGDSAGEAVLVRIDTKSAVFELSGREIALELDR